MKTTQILIAGFGGQGVLFAGKFLAYKGLVQDMQVSWLPSYGPEMRGGTANCTVILSPERIGAPLVETTTEIVVMNRPSLMKFEPTLQPGGIAFINSSIVPDKVTRDDIRAIYVPCDAIAAELGNPKVANMVMLGAYVGATEALKVETIEEMIHEMFTGKKAKLVPLNLEALQRGIQCAKEQMA